MIEDGKVNGLEVAGKYHAFDKVISTIPLPYVPRLMPDLPASILLQFQQLLQLTLCNTSVQMMIHTRLELLQLILQL